MSDSHHIENMLFFSKYKAEKMIGEGSFGRIYLAKHIQTNERFALKFENKTKDQNLLEQEAHILYYLKGGEGIPTVKSFGYSGNYNILIMELLGKSLEDLFQINNKSFSIKTVCMIGEQMLNRIEYVHQKNLIHRDIKPDNFAIGLDDTAKIIYIIDFGLSKKYRSSKTNTHNKYVNNKKLTGTARYASVNALRGYEQSRRDDLESISYILIYFLKGVLPWQNLRQNKKEERYWNILDKKRRITPDELCLGLPIEFKDFVAYTRNLGFEDEPNYSFLRKLLRQVMARSNLKFDYIYDWSIVTRKERMKSLTQLPTEEDIIYNDDSDDCDLDNDVSNLDEKKQNQPMGVNQYKFIQSMRTSNAAAVIDTSRNNNNTNTTNNHHIMNSAFNLHKRVISSPLISNENNRNGVNCNYLRNSTLYYSNNNNDNNHRNFNHNNNLTTAQITTRVPNNTSNTNNGDCIVF